MTADAWLAEHRGELEGLAADDAAARVREAGLRARVVRPGDVVTLDFRPNRVDLQCDADGRVVGTRAG